MSKLSLSPLGKVRKLTTLALAALLVVTTVSPAFAREDVVARMPFFTHTCGPVTCSVYVKRGIVRRVWGSLSRYEGTSNTAIAGAAAAACTPIGGIGAVVCAAAGATYGTAFLETLKAAATSDRCLKLRHLRAAGGASLVHAFSTDNSKFCG